MQLSPLKPRKAINKAYLKVKPIRSEIECFKTNLIQLLDRTNDIESEEFHKNLVSDFLKKTYYEPNHFINTKGRNDLVIHNGNKAKSAVGVIIEAKKPTNKAEMLTNDKINVKAFQELLLYYLRERITHKNLEVKYLIATNINEWFIFDAQVFENLFAQNKGLVKQFTDFENGRLAGTTTDFFYREIAAPFISGLKQDLEYTFFDIRDYEKPLRNNNPKDDNTLISLFKLLSPEHLLKLPFTNDSNSLNKRFYGELLHIIGLSETKNGSKKLIGRKIKGERNTGSFLENAIIQLDSLDKINRLDNPGHFGTSQEERLFNVGLELSITWINRILFLKLLEAQLKTYHKGDTSYEFLSIDKIQNYDDLNSLFFQVLAKQQSERNDDVIELFAKVPYLNSSLFEPTGIEHGTIFISNLRDEKTIPIYAATVLKSENGKKRSGSLSALEYLLEFLNAYDFSSEGSETIQEDNKTLINASVLGLIFEKINGYKDGSFFTPGFITMYMCRETIRKAVVQKFNETKDWNCKEIDSLYDKIEDRQEANDIINSLKICDPAVGSGHFLVSALNEIISIKNDLKILQDRDGKRLKEYVFEVVNDELIVTDEEGELFEYNPNSKESQRIQEALFHEKQTIIENCLFGVDINPNSVKICRLRLWIELLKNAYYKNESELETLPNIDINIKCGNSLISRFELDADLKKALKSSKWTIDSYRIAVDTYRNAQNKEQKRAMEKVINDIKSNFRSEISLNDPKVKRLNKLQGEIFGMTKQTQMFELTKREKTAWNKKLKQLSEASKKLEITIAEIKNNKIYEEAFEWRFEFPEVLDDNGDFIGFDVVIGNPPYVYRNAEITNQKDYYRANYFNTTGNFDLYKFFIELGVRLNKENGLNSLITNSSFLLQTSFEKTREFVLNNSTIESLIPLGGNVFDEATVDSVIYILRKRESKNKTKIIVSSKPIEINESEPYFVDSERFKANEFLVFDYLLTDKEYQIVNRLITKFPKIESGFNFGVGINTGYIKSELTADSKINSSYHPMVPGTGVSKYGNVSTDGYIMYDKKFVQSKGKLGRTLPDEKLFIEPKILVVRTRNISIKERIVATIDYEKKYNLNRISNIIAKPANSLEGLLGIINSKLFNWLYSKRYFDYEIKPIYLRNSPLAETNNLELIAKVNEMLSLKNETDNLTKPKLIADIDEIVFDLYDLTEEEIKIIEEATL